MEQFTSFLGTGWGFPPTFDSTLKQVKTSSDEQDINESLQILLSTRLGERVMLPKYGCNLEELLFSPLDLTLKTYISDLIRTAILYHEPRINVDKIDYSQGDDLQGELLIIIDYTVRATNSRMNMVYPFYRNEANEL